MDIQIRTQEIALPRKGVTDLSRRLSGMVEDLEARVMRVQMTLKDVNGPRGGRDKVCILRAELVCGGEVVVCDRSRHTRRAMGRSVRRLKALVAREMRKRHLKARQQARQMAVAVAAA